MSKTCPTPYEHLCHVREAHELKEQGLSQRQIAEQTKHSRGSIREWLAKPKPTDEQIAESQKRRPGFRTPGGLHSFRTNLDKEVADRLRDEVARQEQPHSVVIGLAVELYLEAVERARGMRKGDLNLKAYLP